MKSLGGPLTGPPSAVSCASDHLSIFATQPGGGLFQWLFKGTTWNPEPLAPVGPGGFPNLPPQGEGICAVSSESDRLEVFAAGSNGNTPWWWRRNGSTWTGPDQLPQGANLLPVPVAVVAAAHDNIDVFAAGERNTPYWWHWNGAWSGPVRLPEGADLPPERIAAISTGPGRLDVFAAGRAGKQLWHWWLEPGSGWRLEPLGGSLPAEGVSAVSWGPNRIDVFAAARLPDGSTPLQHWWSDGVGFAGPESLGGDLAQGTVSAVSSGLNRLDVFGITRDRRIARWQWDGNQWSGPHSVGENVPEGDVSAVFRDPNRIDVFVRGADNTLWQWPGGGLQNGLQSEMWTTLARNWQVPSVPNNDSPIAPNPPLGQHAGRCYPDSLEELVSIVQEAEQLGRHVRAVGSHWSNSDVAVTSDYFVETHKLNREVAGVLSATPPILHGSRANLVHVEAGITLGDLIIMLDKRNLALSVLGGSSGQTLAGAISTSVHGADFRLGPISDYVQAIHLVGPGGVQHWIERSAGITDRAELSKALGIAEANIHQDDDWFNAVVVSVGSMGIIYALIMEVEPQYDLVEHCEWLTWTAVRARLAQGAPGNPFDIADNRAVNVIVNPFTEPDGTRPCFLITRKAQKPATQAYSEGWNLFNEGWFLQGVEPALIGAWELDPKLGGLVSMHEFVTARFRERYPQRPPGPAKKGFAHTITTSPGTPSLRGLALEIAFDATNDAYLNFVDEAGEILKAAYRDHNLGLAGWFSLRFVGPSDAYLSPQNRSDRTCTVEFAALQELSHTRKLLALLEAAGRRHGGIQHWGMFDDLQAADVERAYPRLNTWREIHGRLTNGGTIHTFDNDFSRRCGLSSAPAPKLVAPAASQWAWLTMSKPPTANIRAPLGAVTVMDTPTSPQRAHIFVEGNDFNLWCLWSSGTAWSWLNMSKPPTANISGLVGAVTVMDTPTAPQRAHLFVTGNDGNLWCRWSSGTAWSWLNMSKPPTANIRTPLGAVTVMDTPTSPQRAHIFVEGNDFNLWCLWSSGTAWSWLNMSKPPTANISGFVGAVTVMDTPNAAQRAHLFVLGNDGNVWCRWSSGTAWSWLNMGKPPTANIRAPMGTVTVMDTPTSPQRAHIFVEGDDFNLWCLWSSGTAWSWLNMGKPNTANIVGFVGAVSVMDAPNAAQRAHLFVMGNDGNLWCRWSSGTAWYWTNLGKPHTANISAPLGAVTVKDTPTSAQRPHVFVAGNDGNLWVDWRG